MKLLELADTSSEVMVEKMIELGQVLQLDAVEFRTQDLL